MNHLSISNLWINALLRAFERLKIPASEVCRGLSSFKHTPYLTDQRLPLSEARTMWHQAATYSEDPMLGYKIGQSQDYRSIGIMAPILWHSPSISSALQNIRRYQSLISENGLYSWRSDNNLIHFTYCETDAPIQAHPQQILAVVMGTIKLISDLSSGATHPYAISIPKSYPASQLKALFKCPIHTQGSQVVLIYDKSGLNTPIPGCDPYVYELNRTAAEQILNAKQQGVALIDSVKQAIHKYGYNCASIENVSADLGINNRNLQRYLADQGTKFRLLKEEVMKEYCIKTLSDRPNCLEHTAFELGYTEQSAFHRAFKNWFGVTPLSFIKNNGALPTSENCAPFM